jgi:hypothetical protein
MSVQIDSPQALVAIARAAHLAGDRDLSRVARQQLRDEFGIDLRFLHPRPDHALALSQAGTAAGDGRAGR